MASNTGRLHSNYNVSIMLFFQIHINIFQIQFFSYEMSIQIKFRLIIQFLAIITFLSYLQNLRSSNQLKKFPNLVYSSNNFRWIKKIKQFYLVLFALNRKNIQWNYNYVSKSNLFNNIISMRVTLFF